MREKRDYKNSKVKTEKLLWYTASNSSSSSSGKILKPHVHIYECISFPLSASVRHAPEHTVAGL